MLWNASDFTRGGVADLLAKATCVRRFASGAMLLLLVAYALLSFFTGASLLWQKPGTVGLSTDYDANVRAVTPDGPAARAGIVAGDRIRLDLTPFDDRSYVSGPGVFVPIGRTLTVVVSRDGTIRSIPLTAVPDNFTAAERAALLLQCIASLVFIVVGATLIVLRPNLTTWGFGLYCLLSLPTSMYPAPTPTAALGLAWTLSYDVLFAVGVAGLLLFVLEFPAPFAVPWRERIRRSIPALFVVLAGGTLYPDVANQLLARGAEYENGVLQIGFGALCILAMIVLWDTYQRVERDERERLRWILVGFAFGLFGSYIGSTLIFSTLIAATPPPGVSIALNSLNVLLPLTVAHAVIRHRVLDIRFVAGRALVFAVLTTVLAATFALLDYVFGTVLEDYHIARVIAAAVSLAIAFAFKWFERRATRIIEAIFFRRRLAAEARLGRAAHTLPHARSVAVIETTLIAEAVDALELASAALYRQERAEPFIRTASAGWNDSDVRSLDDTDLLVFALRTDNSVVDLAKFRWRRTDIPTEEREPAIAVPIHLRGELIGFALYGNHSDGGGLEPGDVALLERLAEAAGLAFDQLEAQQLRDESVRQRDVITDLTARLDELRHQL